MTPCPLKHRFTNSSHFDRLFAAVVLLFPVRKPRSFVELNMLQHDATPNGGPLILTIDMPGMPNRWITWQHAVFYHAKDLVAWSAGENVFHFRGGLSRSLGCRSEISTNSIIAIKGRAHSGSLFQVPPLSNRELFHRDRHLCAYCGRLFAGAKLTRDHVRPVSQNGQDVWMNVVTACRPCNQQKSGRTPEQASMELLYAPYIPNKAEYLILCNRQILTDQMDFLARHVPAQSRCKPILAK